MERICANCGEALNETDTVCPKCGTPAPALQAAPTPEQPVAPTPAPKEEKPKGSPVLGIVSIVMGAISWIIPDMVPVGGIDNEIMFFCAFVVVSIVGAILGGISIKKRKGLGIAGLIICLIVAGMLGLAIIGYNSFKLAKDCVPTDDKDIVKCLIVVNGVEMEQELPKEYVSESQMKKEEEPKETKTTEEETTTTEEDTKTADPEATATEPEEGSLEEEETSE